MTSELHLTSLDPNVSVGDNPYAHVIFTRGAEPYRRGSLENFLQQVSIIRSVDVNNVEAFRKGAQELFEVLDAPSGYIHVSSNDTLAHGETAFQVMAPMAPLPSRNADGTIDPIASHDWLHWKHDEDTNDRIRQLDRVRSQIGPRLRGTYWGTFLGRDLVTELGGTARIVRDAPVALVEPLGNGGMYLQLTLTPEPITSSAMKGGLVAFEQFLRPVLVFLPSYFASRFQDQ